VSPMQTGFDFAPKRKSIKPKPEGLVVAVVDPPIRERVKNWDIDRERRDRLNAVAETQRLRILRYYDDYEPECFCTDPGPDAIECGCEAGFGWYFLIYLHDKPGEMTLHEKTPEDLTIVTPFLSLDGIEHWLKEKARFEDVHKDNNVFIYEQTQHKGILRSDGWIFARCGLWQAQEGMKFKWTTCGYRCGICLPCLPNCQCTRCKS
jgi:hypothetical protein